MLEIEEVGFFFRANEARKNWEVGFFLEDLSGKGGDRVVGE
jgi:hypothetical protein